MRASLGSDDPAVRPDTLSPYDMYSIDDAYLIEGGRPLAGRVSVTGAKNSVIKLLAATILAPGRSTLANVPRILDVHWMIDVLRHLGATADWTGTHEVTVDVPDQLEIEAPYDLVRRMRASTAVLGPLLARNGRARVAQPGGCDLGPRPIDLHLVALERMGAEIRVAHGYLEASADELVGAEIELDYPSHGATENALMAAVLAKGTTVVRNASREPEIVDLAHLLERMGARIDGAGTQTITVEGVSSLRPAQLDVMPDRMVAGAYLFAAGAAGGDVTVDDADPTHLEIVLEKLSQAGVEVHVDGSSIRVVADGRPRPVDISTLPYPGFPTDLYPLAVAFLARADGLSIVTENIFDGRFTFVDELVRMGADIHVEGRYVVVRGVPELTGAPVRASDLRAGATLVVGGLAASGRTTVENIHPHVDRGFEDLHLSLNALGASVQRVEAGQLSPA